MPSTQRPSRAAASVGSRIWRPDRGGAWRRAARAARAGRRGRGRRPRRRRRRRERVPAGGHRADARRTSPGRRCGRRPLPESPARGSSSSTRASSTARAFRVCGPLARSRHGERCQRARHGRDPSPSRGSLAERRSAASSPTKARASSHSVRWASATRPLPRRSRARSLGLRSGGRLRPGNRAWTTQASRTRSASSPRMLAVNRPVPDDPIGALASSAASSSRVLAGVALGAASARSVVAARRLHLERGRARRRAARTRSRAAISSRLTARPSRATRSSSRRSVSSRSSTSSCGWGRGAARRSRCRCSRPRAGSSSTWRPSRTPASPTRADDGRRGAPGRARCHRVPHPRARRPARRARWRRRGSRCGALPARRRSRRRRSGAPRRSRSYPGSRPCLPARSPSASPPWSPVRCTSTRSRTRSTRSAGRRANGRSRSCATMPSAPSAPSRSASSASSTPRRSARWLPPTRRSLAAAVAGAAGRAAILPLARALPYARRGGGPGSRRSRASGRVGVVVGVCARRPARRRRRRAWPRRRSERSPPRWRRCSRFFRAWLGGVTGTRLGATAKLCETAALVAYLAAA